MAFESDDTRRLQAFVETYTVLHRHISHARIVVHGADTIAWWETKPERVTHGCYAIYSRIGKLLYIGRASTTKEVVDRLFRFKYDTTVQDEAPGFVQIVEVSEPLEAPPLEGFLIRELHPRYNKNGVHWTV